MDNFAFGPLDPLTLFFHLPNNYYFLLSFQYTEALAQMRATGITDDLLSRRALEASNGNVEMALNLIFEGALD